MTEIKHQNFRSFLTERFTAVAVEIFGEAEAIMEAYYEENKRLRNILHMVVNPEIKLPRIDDLQQTRDVRMEISKPTLFCPKEEETDYEIGLHSVHQQRQHQQQQHQQQQHQQPSPVVLKVHPTSPAVQRFHDNTISLEVKEDPDSDMPFMSDSIHVQTVEIHQGTSATNSSGEAVDEGDCALSENTVTCGSMDEDDADETLDTQDQDEPLGKKMRRRQLQKTMLEVPRMMPYKSAIPNLGDCKTFLERLTEAFKDFPEDKQPLITKMGLSKEVETVECAFGRVPKGSVLSYQCPLPSEKDYQIHDDAPPRPNLPLSQHSLEPVSKFPTLSSTELDYLRLLQITWGTAQSLERSTRPPQGQKELTNELQKQRLTSRFREICYLRPGKSNAKHLVHKIATGGRRCKTSQIDEEMKTEALREYCRNMCVNWYPCGLVVHPNASWLGALPHGLVYDPKESPNFGLVHVKCLQSHSFVDCRFLVNQNGLMQLKKASTLFWQIQGDMMVTGMSWCDLLVFSNEDMVVQRIYRDGALIKTMQKNLNDFYFYHYLPSVSI